MKLYAVFALSKEYKDKPYMEDCIIEDITMEYFNNTILPKLESEGYINIRLLSIDTSPPNFVGSLDMGILDPCFAGKCRT